MSKQSLRRQALVKLMQFHTHSFISVADASPVLAGFGMLGTVKAERVRANEPDDPKGLKNDSGKQEVLEGFSVYRLSLKIADSLPDLPEGSEIGGEFTEVDGERDYGTKLGRGSAARAAWQYIDAVLRREGE